MIDKAMDEDIVLVDPNPKRGYEKVSLEKLLKAIALHGVDNMADFWIILK